MLSFILQTEIHQVSKSKFLCFNPYCCLHRQVTLRGLHSSNQKKMSLRLSFLLSFFRSEFIRVFVLLLNSLPSSIQSSLHLDKNVRGCSLLLLYFLSDLYQLKLCLTTQHSSSYEPYFPFVLVHISVDSDIQSVTIL